MLYERDIPAFENLTNLDRCGHRSVRVALPMKIKAEASAAAGCCLRAANVKVSPSPRLTAEIAESAAELEATAVVREEAGCAG